MLAINARFSTPELDKKSYSRALDLEVEKAMKAAAKAFLITAFPVVPVWTGMSRGSLLNLGRLVDVVIPIVPNPLSKYDQKRGRTIAAGEALGTPSNQIITKNLVTNQRTTWKFHYDTGVLQYIINEGFGGKSPTSPWNSFAKGRDAFFEEFSRVFKPPDINKYLLETVITLSGTRVTKQRTTRIR